MKSIRSKTVTLCERAGHRLVPFEPGEHQRIAVKVIDFRGNEVVRVVKVPHE